MYDFKKRLFIVRHALTEENKKGVCLGWIDTKNSPEELLRVLNLVKNSLDGKKIDCIVSSSLGRSVYTAKAISKKLKIGKLVIDPSFNDLNFGYYARKNPELIKKIQPEMYNKKGFFKYNVCLKEGESLKLLEKRIIGGLKKLYNLSQKERILLVAHGSVIVMIHKILHQKGYYTFYPSVDNRSHDTVFNF